MFSPKQFVTSLQPKPTLTEEESQRALRLFVWEGAATMGLGSIIGGGFLAAYALALGANTFQIGVLAALPSPLRVAYSPDDASREPFAEFEMRLPSGEYGYVLYGHFDQEGKVVMPSGPETPFLHRIVQRWRIERPETNNLSATPAEALFLT